MLIGSAIMLSSPLFDSPQEAHRETPDSGQITHDDLSHFRQRLAKDGVDQKVSNTIMPAWGKSIH